MFGFALSPVDHTCTILFLLFNNYFLFNHTFESPSKYTTEINLILFSAKIYKHMLTVVQHDNMEAVHQLSLVLMDSLHLDIKYRIHIDINVILFLDVICKSNLVFLDKNNEK